MATASPANRARAAVAFALALTGSPGAAQLPAGGSGGNPDLGTGWNILSIPHSSFSARRDTDAWIVINNYLANSGASTLAFQALVQLPSGAGIGRLNLYAEDTGPDSVVASLYRLTGYGVLPQCTQAGCAADPPSMEGVTSVASIAAGGYQYVSSEPLDPLHTVDNNVTSGGGLYLVRVLVPRSSTPPPVTYGFKGVDIWWKRQIAPAPATARFSDVPVTAQFFAEVEALAASGTTQGCTPTTFCPDSPLTRRQMAAFLARVLGLYFPF